MRCFKQRCVNWLYGIILWSTTLNRSAVVNSLTHTTAFVMPRNILCGSKPWIHLNPFDKAQNLKTNININGLAVSNEKDCIAVWDGSQVECYERTSDVTWSRTVQYNSSVDLFAFCGDTFVEVVGSKILLRRQSIVTNKLTFHSGEGTPIGVDTAENFFLVLWNCVRTNKRCLTWGAQWFPYQDMGANCFRAHGGCS